MAGQRTLMCERMGRSAWSARKPSPGANSHLTNTLVRNLLDHGYTVRGTVQDLSDPVRTAHLHAHAKALGCPEQLDWWKPTCWTPTHGPPCWRAWTVVHTATVFSLSGRRGDHRHREPRNGTFRARCCDRRHVPHRVHLFDGRGQEAAPKGRTKTERGLAAGGRHPVHGGQNAGVSNAFGAWSKNSTSTCRSSTQARHGGGFVRPTPSIDYFPDLLAGA